MRLQKLKNVILAPMSEDVDTDKNEEAFAELIQFLDDKSLYLVMRDAVDDGRAALNILCSGYREILGRFCPFRNCQMH